jgi:hypothetical protein
VPPYAAVNPECVLWRAIGLNGLLCFCEVSLRCLFGQGCTDSSTIGFVPDERQ